MTSKTVVNFNGNLETPEMLERSKIRRFVARGHGSKIDRFGFHDKETA